MMPSKSQIREFGGDPETLHFIGPPKACWTFTSPEGDTWTVAAEGWRDHRGDQVHPGQVYHWPSFAQGDGDDVGILAQQCLLAERCCPMGPDHPGPCGIHVQEEEGGEWRCNCGAYW